jgi:hypothetical protein
MGSSIAKFVAQIVECDYRKTYCPKCETTCDQCGNPVKPIFNTPKSFQYDEGLIMFADCYDVGFCSVDRYDIPCHIHAKYLISVVCLNCDQKNKYYGGTKPYHNFMEKAKLDKNFDLVTEEKETVKRVPKIITKNIIKKCCIKCTDAYEDNDDHIIENYKNLPIRNMTRYYKHEYDTDNDKYVHDNDDYDNYNGYDNDDYD